jgi:hypothetical protein
MIEHKGKDIRRVVVTAEAALSRGLEAWLSPLQTTEVVKAFAGHSEMKVMIIFFLRPADGN